MLFRSEDRKTGLLVKERDTEDLIRAVREFMEMSYEQRKEMGIKARQKMEREFDRRFVVESYLKELKRILG